jgi:hypothetical protein
MTYFKPVDYDADGSNIGFETTSAMLNWIFKTKISGPVVVLDKWTYGFVMVLPDGSWTTKIPGCV